MKHIYWFEELSKDSLKVAGGKGANLGEMMKIFPVPPGFVVSSESYFKFIKENKIDLLIKDLLTTLDVKDTKALEDASFQLKNAIIGTPISDDIRDAIVDAYGKLCESAGIEEAYVAVRSSATAEDLPTASFAGQQASFLNVKGGDELLKAVKKCWASLFESRAIFYRVEQGFEHIKVGLAAVVQMMIQSERSGVLFTVDPISQDPNKMVVEAVYGLGEAIVSGAVTPDKYVIDKRTLKIIDRKIAKQEWMITKVDTETAKGIIKKEFQAMQKLADPQIQELAKIARDIERHYAFPQDIEWAVEGDKIYIVQSRPITTLRPEVAERVAKTLAKVSPVAAPSQTVPLPTPATPAVPSVAPSAPIPIPAPAAASVAEARVLVRGLGASPGFAVGVVKQVPTASEISLMQSGEILVTKMTTPDFVPAMRKASAIITDEGGTTCHAAIVSRELGIPCIVGTMEATKRLRDGMEVTIDADKGFVYEGKLDIAAVKVEEKARFMEYAPVTGTKIYVNVAEPEIAEKVAKLPCDGVGLLRAEFMIAGIGAHPRAMYDAGREQEFIDALVDGIARIAGAFYPRPVVYRTTDFKSNEYRNLPGGEKYEPIEANPMMGYRGCARYIREPEVFKMELKAIKKIREEMNLKNVWIMLPFVRRTGEIQEIKRLMNEVGLHRTKDFKLWIMVEVPSTVFMINEFCEMGIDGVSIGSNDLTQLIMGVDRDNAYMATEFDERNTAVLKAIKRVVEGCKKHGVTVSLCGQAPSVWTEFAEKLVEFGITSMSVNPDAIERTRRIVSSAERKVMLDKLRKIEKP